MILPEQTQIILPGKCELDDKVRGVVLVYSSDKCVFCRKLLNDFETFSPPKNYPIVFIEYDTSEEEILSRQIAYKESQVRVNLNSEYEINFFPTIHVHLANSTRRRRLKGYTPQRWQDIEKILNRNDRKLSRIN